MRKRTGGGGGKRIKIDLWLAPSVFLLEKGILVTKFQVILQWDLCLCGVGDKIESLGSFQGFPDILIKWITLI